MPRAKMGAKGGAYGRFARSKDFAGQVGLRSRESRFPQSLNTLRIGVCGIFMFGRSPCAREKPFATQAKRHRENLRAKASTAESQRTPRKPKSAARSGCATMVGEITEGRWIYLKKW